MPSTRIVVVRHGNTFQKGDVILRVGARTDLPLTSEGREQGRKIAQRFKERSLEPSAYFVAPLKRTRETQLEIAEEMALASTCSSLDFLTELDYGEDDGKPENEVLNRIGKIEALQKGLPLDELSQDQFATLGKEALKEWDAHATLPCAWRSLQSRVDALPKQWKEFAQNVLQKYRGRTVVAVTSNDIARFSFDIVSDASQRPDNLKLSTGKYCVYLWDETNSRWMLEVWNE